MDIGRLKPLLAGSFAIQPDKAAICFGRRIQKPPRRRLHAGLILQADSLGPQRGGTSKTDNPDEQNKSRNSVHGHLPIWPFLTSLLYYH
jgi:hypothetical protein